MSREVTAGFPPTTPFRSQSVQGQFSSYPAVDSPLPVINIFVHNYSSHTFASISLLPIVHLQLSPLNFLELSPRSLSCLFGLAFHSAERAGKFMYSKTCLGRQLKYQCLIIGNTVESCLFVGSMLVDTVIKILLVHGNNFNSYLCNKFGAR